MALNAAQKAQHKVAARKLLEKGIAEGKRKKMIENAKDAAQLGSDAGTLDGIADSLVKALEDGELDYRELMPTVADLDPTGVLSVVRCPSTSRSASNW